MKDSLKETAARLSQAETHENRRNLILQILKENGTEVSVMEEDGTVNILAGPIAAEGCRNRPVLFAHYDIVPESSGANDNLSSVSILLHLLSETKNALSAVFLDREESGHEGAGLFIKQIKGNRPSAAIVLDVCGYGNTEAFHIRNGHFDPLIRKMTGRKCRKKYRLHPLSSLPESDDGVLAGMNVPTMLISVLPESDVQAMEAFGRCFGPLQSRSAEYGIMMDSLEIMQTVHGGALDDPEYLMETSMQQVLDHLKQTLFE